MPGLGCCPAAKGATGPLIGLVLLCLFLTIWTDTFFSVRNFLNILDQITVLGIMAVGMTLVILIGGHRPGGRLGDGADDDGAGLPQRRGRSCPWGSPSRYALGAAAVNGLIAGMLITRFNVPAFIATLAMMSIARGLANMITNGQQLIGFPPWFNMSAIIRFGGFLTLTVALMLVVFVAGAALSALPLRRARHSTPSVATPRSRAWRASTSSA